MILGRSSKLIASVQPEDVRGHPFPDSVETVF